MDGTVYEDAYAWMSWMICMDGDERTDEVAGR